MAKRDGAAVAPLAVASRQSDPEIVCERAGGLRGAVRSANGGCVVWRSMRPAAPYVLGPAIITRSQQLTCQDGEEMHGCALRGGALRARVAACSGDAVAHVRRYGCVTLQARGEATAWKNPSTMRNKFANV